jgi:hypothetical protein
MPGKGRYMADLSRGRLDLMFSPGMSIRIRVDNKSQQKYFCSLLYLNNTFGVSTHLIDGRVKQIQPGESEWILNGRPIPVVLEDHIMTLGQPYSLSYLKLIVNQDMFSVDGFELDSLPPPTLAAHTVSSRGLDIMPDKNVLDWFTEVIELKIHNPHFTQSNSN